MAASVWRARGRGQALCAKAQRKEGLAPRQSTWGQASVHCPFLHSFPPSFPPTQQGFIACLLLGQGTGTKLTRCLCCEAHSIQEKTDHSQFHQINKYINEQNSDRLWCSVLKAVVTTTKQSVLLCYLDAHLEETALFPGMSFKTW